MKVFFQEAFPEERAIPGAVIAIQSFGDFLGFNPHLHVLCSDGCFYGNGSFRVAPRFEIKGLENIFRHNVFKMLLSKEKITEELIDMLINWRHSGFNVFCGPRNRGPALKRWGLSSRRVRRIQPGDEEAMENLARYIIRASFSQERMTYIPKESKVVYQSKDDKEEEIFDALEWLAAMCSHVPNKGESFDLEALSAGPKGLQVERPDGSSKEHRKNWARLIQKIYETDHLCCPKCQGRMKVISVIEDPEIVKKILKHLGLWEVKARPPPKTNAPSSNINIDYSSSQIPISEEHLFHDPEYPIEAYAS